MNYHADYWRCFDGSAVCDCDEDSGASATYAHVVFYRVDEKGSRRVYVHEPPCAAAPVGMGQDVTSYGGIILGGRVWPEAATHASASAVGDALLTRLERTCSIPDSWHSGHICEWI